MNHVTKKLKSERGASILLALLFFLLCIITASIILMAAASNAGKARSNYEAQQTYLTVSSALQLVCDDLTANTYCGVYNYKVVTDDDGAEVKRIYSQRAGQCATTLGNALREDFDWIFGERMKADIAKLTGVSAEYENGTGVPGIAGPQPHDLTVEIEDFELYDKDTDTFRQWEGSSVNVTLTVVPESYSIELTAEMNGYRMMAELTAASTQPGLLESSSEGENTSGPMSWTLGWVSKAGTGG